MTAVSITPVSRSLTPGGKATFAVEVTLGPAAALVVRPDRLARGYDAHFAGGGAEVLGAPGRQVLTVEVPRGAGMA